MNNTAYLAILRTHYELYVVAESEESAKKRIVEAYKKFYGKHRQLEKPTYKELNEYYGCPIYKVDTTKGFIVEGS